jgi:hypothetical protein
MFGSFFFNKKISFFSFVSYFNYNKIVVGINGKNANLY